MKTKRCSKCGEEKLVSEFSFKIKARNVRQSKCKVCVLEWDREYRKRPEVIKREKVRQSSDHYKEVAKAWQSRPEFRAKRRTQANSRNRLDTHKKWRREYESRPEVRELINSQMREYRQTDKWKDWVHRRYWENDKHRINTCMRSAITRCMNGEKNGRHWFDIVGYNLEDLMGHIEKQFDDGMAWDNYGDWEIDHRIPLSAFNFKTHEDIDFQKAWSLSNLQPLWKFDNRSKGAKLEAPFQPSLAFGGAYQQ